MGKEYDLINELGPKNWLDVVAGEAVVLGHFLNDPCLVVRGTELAALIREIPFDSDEFCQVEAKAMALSDELITRREQEKASMFIEDIYLGKEREKSSYDWQFSFIYAGGRYQIQLIMPMYYDKTVLDNPIKADAEDRIKKTFDDPSFQSYRSETVSTRCQGQTFINTRFFDQGMEIRRIVDFNHHGKSARGWIDYYYFDDYSKAHEAWQGVREAFISGQKR